VLLVLACSSGSGPPDGTEPEAVIATAVTAGATPAPPATPATQASAPPPAQAPAGNGLSAEADLAINPPPPQRLRVQVVSSGVVELAWEPPPAVSVAHSYSDEVVHYVIYRRAAGALEFEAVGRSTGLGFRDASAPSGRVLEYAVSSVRRQNVEGGRSHPPVTARVP
jgi:hypothetical protein